MKKSEVKASYKEGDTDIKSFDGEAILKRMEERTAEEATAKSSKAPPRPASTPRAAL